MYSDLLEALGNQAGGRGRGGDSAEAEKHVALTFKAGKCNMESKESGAYWVTPDTRRGQVQLVWQSNELNWEWSDRRVPDEVKETFVVRAGGTLQRIATSKGVEDANERVYVWTSPSADGTSKQHRMYWMQDEYKEEEEDEVVAKINQFLLNPRDAAPEGEQQEEDATPGEGAGATSADALSNILSSIPLPPETPASSSETPAAAPGARALTMADLQGAMANLSGPNDAMAVQPMTDEMYKAAMSELTSDPAVRARLLELLPESQQNDSDLEENLQSPQLRSTFRALFAALLPDDTGSMEGYHSLIANFQLNPTDGEAAMRAGNPIKAFLESIIKSVEKKEEESKEESKDDDKMEE